MRKTLIVVAVVVVGLVALAAGAKYVVAASGKMLKVGDAFPTWSLPDQTGATVTSQSLAGKPYLLWYYPKAQTPGCTTEGRGLRDRFDEFKAAGVEVLGVSFDKPEANAAFVKAESFPFRLLSDSDGALAKSVGAVAFDLQPVSSRISYLVGPDGKVLKAYDEVTPATHAADVLTDIKK